MAPVESLATTESIPSCAPDPKTMFAFEWPSINCQYLFSPVFVRLKVSTNQQQNEPISSVSVFNVWADVVESSEKWESSPSSIKPDLADMLEN